jgi:hypothetical protein
LEVKSKGWKLPYILVFSTPMNRGNLSELVHFISNHCYINCTHCFVNVSPIARNTYIRTLSEEPTHLDFIGKDDKFLYK